jgi:hypothetical protein
MVDDKISRVYFVAMSRAMAKLCNVFATVTHSDEQYEDPPRDGIWGTVEFDQLIKPREDQFLGGVEVELIKKNRIFPISRSSFC